MDPIATNRPTLDAARYLPVCDLLALPAPHLALLQEEARTSLEAAKRLHDWIEGIIAVRYGERSIALRAEQHKDTGTVRFTDGGVTVVADLPKRVEWDQGKLAAVVERIRATGDDPTEYVEISYKVPERAFTVWPEHIRTAFTAARTVRTGRTTFKLSLDAAQGDI